MQGILLMRSPDILLFMQMACDIADQVERASPGVRSPVAAETDHWSVRAKVLTDVTGPLKAGILWKRKRQNSYGKNFREA